jgi:hypothetical protein
MTTNRDKLLAQVSGYVQRYLGKGSALEHNTGDYKFQGKHRDTDGMPIALWSFAGDNSSSVPFTGQRDTVFFHIDEANNQALVVHRAGPLHGSGCLINGKDGSVHRCWRS